jgi:hypothetical protein
MAHPDDVSVDRSEGNEESRPRGRGRPAAEALAEVARVTSETLELASVG